jgi:hypothetical protein
MTGHRSYNTAPERELRTTGRAECILPDRWNTAC